MTIFVSIEIQINLILHIPRMICQTVNISLHIVCGKLDKNWKILSHHEYKIGSSHFSVLFVVEHTKPRKSFE